MTTRDDAKEQPAGRPNTEGREDDDEYGTEAEAVAWRHGERFQPDRCCSHGVLARYLRCETRSALTPACGLNRRVARVSDGIEKGVVVAPAVQL